MASAFIWCGKLRILNLLSDGKCIGLHCWSQPCKSINLVQWFSAVKVLHLSESINMLWSHHGCSKAICWEIILYAWYRQVISHLVFLAVITETMNQVNATLSNYKLVHEKPAKFSIKKGKPGSYMNQKKSCLSLPV